MWDRRIIASYLYVGGFVGWNENKPQRWGFLRAGPLFRSQRQRDRAGPAVYEVVISFSATVNKKSQLRLRGVLFLVVRCGASSLFHNIESQCFLILTSIIWKRCFCLLQPFWGSVLRWAQFTYSYSVLALLGSTLQCSDARFYWWLLWKTGSKTQMRISF